MKLSDFKALTFDVYGTLLDWEGGMITRTLEGTSASVLLRTLI